MPGFGVPSDALPAIGEYQVIFIVSSLVLVLEQPAFYAFRCVLGVSKTPELAWRYHQR